MRLQRSRHLDLLRRPAIKQLIVFLPMRRQRPTPASTPLAPPAVDESAHARQRRAGNLRQAVVVVALLAAPALTFLRVA